ncbi:phage integrase N-terminal SAM-like domain-containing protein [Jiella pacifica]|uniref:Site-specific integrase n=1 Tax=Jiella pacifica TaxID=2696469 RepID=A0A6N9SXY6_9HYPH|nr:phage integrase N-terminal SAM-like domain-containing protein [Jiella pacifica]NDW03943.1 site-specific integrase [Jiella pacifica]
MTMRRFSRETQRNYLGDIGRLAAFLERSADTASTEDLRRFQVAMQEGGVGVPTMNAVVSALRFFLVHTLDRPDLARKLVRLRYPRTLPDGALSRPAWRRGSHSGVGSGGRGL